MGRPIMTQHPATHSDFDGPAQTDDRDELCIDTIRMLSIDAVRKAEAGHPGVPTGAAAMAWGLWTRHLLHNPIVGVDHFGAWPRDRSSCASSLSHPSASSRRRRRY
jgi:transketolase